MRIIDLDNCIADDAWRIHDIDWSQTDLTLRYKQYHFLGSEDAIHNTDLVNDRNDLIIMTSRPDIYRDMTKDWLKRKGVSYAHLIMRPLGDHRHSIDLKRTQLGWLPSLYDIPLSEIEDAYDDREDIVAMYIEHGIKAYVRKIHDVSYEPAPQNVPSILQTAAKTFEERNKVYGDNYKHFGHVMAAAFPGGLAVESAEDWNRLGLLVQCVSKLTRYAASFDKGGHKDSAHDLCVYAAMLEELTKCSK